MHEDPLHTNHHHRHISDARTVGNTARSTHPTTTAAAATAAATDNAAADTAMMNHHHHNNNLPHQRLHTEEGKKTREEEQPAVVDKKGKEEEKINDTEENNQNDEEHDNDAADKNQNGELRPPPLCVPIHGQVIEDYDNDGNDGEVAADHSRRDQPQELLTEEEDEDEDEDEENAKQTPPIPRGVVVDHDDTDHDHYIPTATMTEDSQVQVQFEVENATGIAVEDHPGREGIIDDHGDDTQHELQVVRYNPNPNATVEDGIDIYLQHMEDRNGEDRFRYTIDVDAMHAVFSAKNCDQTIGASLNRMKMIQIISSRPIYPVRSRMIIRVLITLFLREWEVEQKCNSNNGAGIDRLVVKFIDSFRRGSSMHLHEQQLQSDEDVLAIDILFSSNSCRYRDDSLRRIKMIGIITRSTEFPLRQRDKIRSLLDRFLDQTVEDYLDNNNNVNMDIDPFVTTFLDSLRRDILDMITDTRTEENGYRGLDSTQDADAEVVTMLRFFPINLVSQIAKGQYNFYPIQCLLFIKCNIKAAPFVPIFAAVAIDLNLFEKNQRGGLLVEDPFREGGLNILSILATATFRSESDRRLRDVVMFRVLVRLRQLGLFVKEDIQQYKLVNKLCKHLFFKEDRFHFLVQWDPSALLIEDERGYLPLHWAAKDSTNNYHRFRIVFESYITYYPLKVGIGCLFRTRFGRPREMTSIEIACRNNQTATVVDIVVDIVESILNQAVIKLDMVEAMGMTAIDANIHVSGTYFLFRMNPASFIENLVSQEAVTDAVTVDEATAPLLQYHRSVLNV